MDEKRDSKVASFTQKKKEKEMEEIEEELDLVDRVINDPEFNIRQVFTNEVNFRTLLQVLYDKGIVSEEEIVNKYNEVVHDVVSERLQMFGIKVSADDDKDAE